MKITYDKEADALYIHLLEGRFECRTVVAVSSSGTVGDDSGKTVVLAMPADMTQRGGAVVAQQRSDDRVSTRFTVLAEVANRDVRVEKVLRTLASGADPVNPYRAFEFIEDDAGSRMVTNGWTTKAKIGRFTRTVNSVGALGAEARHAVKRERPPRNPMSMAEARAFVMRLVEEWAASK